MQDQPERAIRVLAKMKNLKILPDIRTYELLFSLFGNVNAPYEEGNMLSQVDAAKRISTIEMDMTKNGIQHSHGSFKNLVTFGYGFFFMNTFSLNLTVKHKIILHLELHSLSYISHIIKALRNSTIL